MNQSTNSSQIHIKITVAHDEKDGVGFRWRELKQFEIDGEQVVGVEEGEAFAIHVSPKIAGTSSSRESAEVRISIDGTDVLTGEKAGLGVEGKRWLVTTNGTLALEAWPQSEQGGARFVFTRPESSVAAHTHGDTSHVGIVGVALFVESSQEALMMRSVLRSTPRSQPHPLSNLGGGATYDSYTSSPTFGESQHRTMGISGLTPASVGAGEFTEQRLQSVAGLQAPRLHATSHVRYMWWEDLQALLNRERPAPRTPGFPAATPAFTGINLGSTPTTPSTAAAELRSRFAS